MSDALNSLKPRELMKAFIENATPRELDTWADKGLRHKSGAEPHDYLTHWLSIARHFGFATHDDSWGELEKEFSIIIQRLVVAERDLAKLRSTAALSALVAPQCEYCGTEKPIRADVLVCREAPCPLRRSGGLG